LDNITGVGHLIELKKLYLTGNNLKVFPIEELLPICGHLQELSLSENPINELPEQILHLVKLTSLDLSKLELVNIPFADKLNANLPELKSIYLKGNNFPKAVRKSIELAFGKKAFLEDDKESKDTSTSVKGKETIVIDDEDEDDDNSGEDGEEDDDINAFFLGGDSEDDEEYIENNDQDSEISEEDSDGVFVSSDDEALGELKAPPPSEGFSDDEDDQEKGSSTKKRKRKGADDEDKTHAKKKKKVPE